MWHEIERKKAELDAKRPLTPGSIAQLDAWYDVELTYTSNAIEGNTLTRNETALVIEKGITIGGKTLKEHLEAVDHHEAIGFVRELATKRRPIREDDVRDIHGIVLSRSMPEEAGRYSTVQRRIKGSNVILPGPHKIAPLMDAFGGWLSEQPDTPANAFEAHYRLVAIHPFSDGNGRTARLLTNLILLRGGYPPVAIGPEQRKDYVDGLEHRHMTGEAGPYEAFMVSRLNVSLDAYLDAIEKELEARRGGPAPSASEP